MTVKIAVEGEPVRPRTVYLAPDGYHLGVSRRAAIHLSDAPPVGGFRPAADHLFDSAARAFGSDLTAVVLTGMGQDGVAGLRMVRQRGGNVIAQDEATCVVYGMPKAAFEAGLVDERLPLAGIAPRLIERIGGSRARR
jgi:two-component system chemotaxis response regulator CheB